MNFGLLKRGKPSEELLILLRGPVPPADFKDNGCSFSFDFTFTDPCRRHDYHYYRCAQDYWYQGKAKWRAERKLADQNLRFNIGILCMKVVDGEVVKPWWFFMSYYFQWTRYVAVRCFGRRSARPKR